LAAEFEAARMEKMDAYIALRGSYNIAEFSDVPPERMKLYTTHWWKPVHIDIRVPKTKWVVLRWPHPSMAQQANMSTDAFEDFYFNVCTMDYEKMSKAMDPLVDRLLKADKVHITGIDTDLHFSIKDIPVKKADGDRNIPDGEIFTAPVKDSVEGSITYNTKTIYHGITFENIHFEFENGKIIKATADKTDKLNEILDTDEGARYIGEFAFGLNPFITEPMLDILFDEKIEGSIHFTPGGAYSETDNGNKSEVHWDIVLMQTPAYGGGEIYFDGELIRKEGLFVPADLEPLNPDNLK
jgi:aminopeptidase